ncbi:peptidoglycan-associated lipoprotein Pal [Desulfoluna spongiiphila]|nr:peptidoglycan-associated lipoprotein Pal [Desulfoluna spongiiphila]
MMGKNWRGSLALITVLLTMLVAVSCSQKPVETDPTTDAAAQEAMTDEAADATAAADDAAMIAEEELMKKEAAARAEARSAFENTNIFFNYDSSAVQDSEIAALEAKAEWLKENPGVRITIEGHCDDRGTTDYNLALGDRRAARVKAFLESLGVDADRMVTVSYGEERPADPAANESAWAKNRRAEFVIR